MRGRMDDRKSYAKPVGIGEVMTGESVRGHRLRPPRLCARRYRSWLLLAGAPMPREGPAHVTRPEACADHDWLRRARHAGLTAHSGLLRSRQAPKLARLSSLPRQGPVGSLVGQLAKMAGARAVGTAGGADNVATVDELGSMPVSTAQPIFQRSRSRLSERYRCLFRKCGGAISCCRCSTPMHACRCAGSSSVQRDRAGHDLISCRRPCGRS